MHRNPPTLLPALGLALALAGCLAAPPAGDPGAPGSGAGGFQQVCLTNWADACTARASFNESPAKTEIDLAVNPTDPMNVFVASKDLDPTASNCVWSIGQVTKDAGRTWDTTYVGGTLQERSDPRHPLFGWSCITDPILAFDPGGRLYYPLQAYNAGDTRGPQCPLESLTAQLPAAVLACGSAFFLAVSDDGGATFPAERIIPMAVADGTVAFHDYPRMAVSPTTGSVSTVWNAVGLGVNPYVVTTRDRGASVGPPVVVAAPGAPRSTAFASGYAAGPDGAFHMTVRTFDPNPLGAAAPAPVQLATSTDDARSFGGFTPMFEVTPIECPLPNTEFRCSTSIELAADAGEGPRRGWLYAVWDDGRNGHADVYAARSEDRGATWSEPVRVNRDATTHAQWMPRAEVSADGTLHVLFMDRAHDPGDRLYDLTWAWSTDGGATWQDRRLTSGSSDGDLGVHQNGFPFIGDYNGLDSAGGEVWFGFPQTLTGVAEIAVAHARGPAAAPAEAPAGAAPGGG